MQINGAALELTEIAKTKKDETGYTYKYSESLVESRMPYIYIITSHSDVEPSHTANTQTRKITTTNTTYI